MHFFFLLTITRANSRTAANKQQGNPQSRVACVAGLRKIVDHFGFNIGLFFKRRYRIFDSFCHCIYRALLGDVLVAGNSFNGGFHTGEILVVILLQSVCLGNGFVNLSVVGR